jgi:large subunit ribosomal protein L6
VPDGVTVTVPKQTEIVVEGEDQQLVGQVAANIREWRRPEPYKGKGIMYKDEYIFRKEGKKK